MSNDLITLFEHADPLAQMTTNEISSLYCTSAEKGDFDLVVAMTPFVEQHRSIIRAGAADIVHMGFAYAAYGNHLAMVDYLWDFVEKNEHSDCVSAAGERGHLDMLQKYLTHYPLDPQSLSHRRALMDAARYRKREIVEQMIPYFFPLNMKDFAQNVKATGDWVDQMALHLINDVQCIFQEQANREQHERIAHQVDTETNASVLKTSRKL